MKINISLLSGCCLWTLRKKNQKKIAGLRFRDLSLRVESEFLWHPVHWSSQVRAVSSQPAKFPVRGFPQLSHTTKKSVYREQYRDRILFSKAMLIQGISYYVYFALYSLMLNFGLWIARRWRARFLLASNFGVLFPLARGLYRKIIIITIKIKD